MPATPPESNHVPQPQPVPGGEIRLTCSCGRLDRTVARDGLTSAWRFHLRVLGQSPRDEDDPILDSAINAPAVSRSHTGRPERPARRPPPPSAPGARSVRQRAPGAAGSGIGRPRASMQISTRVGKLLWQIIWPLAAEGTGLEPRALAVYRGNDTDVLGRRILGLTFCRFIAGVSLKALAAELNCKSNRFAYAANRLPAYLHAVPDLAEVAAEISRQTGIALPAELLTPNPEGSPQRRITGRLDDTRRDRILAVFYIFNEVLWDGLSGELPSETHIAWLRLALAIVVGSDHGDLLGSHAMKRELAAKLGFDMSVIYRALRNTRQDLKDYPALVELTQRVVKRLEDEGFKEIKLPASWPVPRP